MIDLNAWIDNHVHPVKKASSVNHYIVPILIVLGFALGLAGCVLDLRERRQERMSAEPVLAAYFRKTLRSKHMRDFLARRRP